MLMLLLLLLLLSAGFGAVSQSNATGPVRCHRNNSPPIPIQCISDVDTEGAHDGSPVAGGDFMGLNESLWRWILRRSIPKDPPIGRKTPNRREGRHSRCLWWAPDGDAGSSYSMNNAEIGSIRRGQPAENGPVVQAGLSSTKFLFQKIKYDNDLSATMQIKASDASSNEPRR